MRTPRFPAPRFPVPRVPVLACVALLALIPLLSGCLTRSSTVGDQFSGFIVVAASPNVGPAAPTFDVPASIAGSVSVTPYPGDAAVERPSGGNPNAITGKVGSQLTFTNLTTGQFSQLGDIISSALDAGATITLGATRRGEIVRVRGTATLTGLTPQTYYVSITVEFGGTVVATNGTTAGESAVTWIPEPGQSDEFNADAKYADPATAAMPGWTTFLALLCLGIVALVGAIAYRFRDRSARYVPSGAERVADRPGFVTKLGDFAQRQKAKRAHGRATSTADAATGDGSTGSGAVGADTDAADRD
ncbi:MAG: hypothetical protein WAW85_15550 [Gordonia sp. (in: high G+C Gram-positive bacteria)]|uniref:LppM family (lipo)protein n=1 Tax=Gordonia sp. (in: high G+C Gram-positive bacteria) TaxID=84139 RepID=UPI003BB70C0E